MPRTLAVLATVLAIGAGTTACSDVGNPFDPGPQACTLIGCENSLAFELSDVDLQPEVPYDIEVCLDLDCTRETVEVTDEGTLGPISVDVVTDRVVLTGLEGDLSGEHDVSLEIRDGTGTAIATANTSTRFEGSQPNGEGCPPTCWAATVEV